MLLIDVLYVIMCPHSNKHGAATFYQKCVGMRTKVDAEECKLLGVMNHLVDDADPSPDHHHLKTQFVNEINAEN